MPTVEIETLRPFDANPRRGNVSRIAESLEHLGQYRPIVVNIGSLTGRANEVLAGNHTLAAAKSLGWSEIDAHVIDVDDETAKRIVIVDNRTNDLATYDNAELAALLDSLPSLDATAWTSEELDALHEQMRGGPLAPEGDADTSEPLVAWGVVIDCSTEDEQARLIERLLSEGFSVRALM